MSEPPGDSRDEDDAGGAPGDPRDEDDAGGAPGGPRDEDDAVGAPGEPRDEDGTVGAPGGPRDEDETSGPQPDPPAGGLPSGIVLVFYGLMAGLGWVIAWIFDVPSVWWTEPGPPGPISEGLGLLLGLLVGLLAHAGSNLVRRVFGWTQGFFEQMRRMLGPLSTGQVVIAASASAIGEEVLFRGALLPVIGLWPQAILFGLVHLAPGRQFRFWPFYAAAMGLILGLLYQATGSLLAPILAHFTVNFFGLSALQKAPPASGQRAA